MSGDAPAPYTIIGSAPIEQMPAPPKPRRPGVWIELAKRLMQDYDAGFVTVISMNGEDDLDRLKNGIRLPLRDLDASLRLSISVVPDNGKYRVYLRLQKKQNGG